MNQQKKTSPYSFGVEDEEMKCNSTKSPSKTNSRKLKKITRDREECSEDTEPEFVSVFIEKEVNVPTEDSNTEEVHPNSESFSLKFYSKRAKSTSPLSSPKNKKDTRRALHSPHNQVSSFKEDRGFNTQMNAKHFNKEADLQAYANFKGKNLPDVMQRDPRGIRGLLRETSPLKDLQKLPQPIMNDHKLFELEKIYGKGVDELIKKKREKFPPEFRIRKQKKSSGSDSGNENSRDISRGINDIALPPIQVKNKNENVMFNINFIVNNQKEMPSPMFQNTSYREELNAQKPQANNKGSGKGNGKIKFNLIDKIMRDIDMEKVHTPTFLNHGQEQPPALKKQQGNANAKVDFREREISKLEKKVYEYGQNLDTRDLLELKESITKFYKKLNNERDQFMQANRALASRLGVRENRSKSPPLQPQIKARNEGNKALN